MTKIGLGYDLHRLTENRALVLGGVSIPFEKGESGHSDGDVLLHAVIDSFLGAAGLGDIGELFPPSASEWKNADSAKLTKIAWKKVVESGFKLVNLDCVLCLEKPKILPFRKKIIESISNILEVDFQQVFVKAKTAEGCGEIGSGLAVQAWAVCLLEKSL